MLVADVGFTGEGGGARGREGAATAGAPPPGAQWDDGGLERRTSELETVRLLRQLTVRQAGVVVLVDLDGYTIDQAARILGVHRGTVALTRRRALDKLRGSLRQRPARTERSGHPDRAKRRGGERHAC